MEIEAKYRVTEADLERVAALRELDPYTLRPAPAPELQHNRYFDTADRRLANARHGLRVRRIGERTLITFKGPAEIADTGLYRRSEHEFPGADPDPHSWPAGPARDLALELIGDAPLIQLLTIDTTRHILHVTHAGQDLAEICLDRGTIRAGGREAPICELEIELLPAGDPADIDALAAALARQISLQPELRSKLRRGMELLDRSTQ